MHRYSIYGTLVLILFGLLLCSCKAKYLEIEAAYNKARQKKTEMEKENRDLKAENVALKDSLDLKVENYRAITEFSKQVFEIEQSKKKFLEEGVPHYLELKKTQQIPVKKKNK